MEKIQEKIKKLPNNPGIYLFYNNKKELVYVGKATSLKNRVRSYFSGAKTSRPIEQMIHEVVNIKYKETDSVLEAIILEANYIKKYQPKYNVDGKDDKSWNYIIITKDDYPQVKTIRSHEIGGRDMSRLVPPNVAETFGPYPGLKTKATMGLLQKLFNISFCKSSAKRECLYHQMGVCLGVCTGDITSKEYKQAVIKPLVMFLRGNKKRLIISLAKKMKEKAKQEDFEEAARLRNQIKSLQRIQDIALLNKSFFSDVKKSKEDIRIEGYDISNLGVTGKVGSMVVFERGEANKSQYRKFKIRGVEGQSDVDCLDEVIRRRLNHPEWRFPDVFLIDGGLPQVNRVKKILKELNIDIPVVGIAKGAERKKNEFILGNKKREFIKWVDKNKVLLIKVRDEAHRFAITYQRSLRGIKKHLS
jgi:excinuclease ABC subunit C